MTVKEGLEFDAVISALNDNFGKSLMFVPSDSGTEGAFQIEARSSLITWIGALSDDFYKEFNYIVSHIAPNLEVCWNNTRTTFWFHEKAQWVAGAEC